MQRVLQRIAQGTERAKKTGNVTVRQKHAREKEHYQAKGKKALPVLFLCQ